MLASYGQDFASGWGKKVREALDEFGESLFSIKLKADTRAADWLEIASHEGALYTCGAGSTLTGRGGSYLVVDDPHKSMQEALSLVIRETIWEWWKLTVRSRLHDPGAVVMISTRWLEDDLPGRLLKAAEEGGDQWTVLRFPAIATEDEVWKDSSGETIWKRKKGEALCSELFHLETLLETKKAIGQWAWETQYQQNPFPREAGSFFKRANFLPVLGVPWTDVYSRGWDLASTSAGGDYTVGVRMSKDRDGETITIEDVVRGQWGPGERDAIMLHTAKLDPPDTVQIVIQDPAQAGKDQAERLRAMFLREGFRCEIGNVKGDARVAVGDKDLRAEPFAAYSQTGRIRIIKGDWNSDFLAELDAFPTGRHDDQVDAASTAYAHIINRAIGYPAGILQQAAQKIQIEAYNRRHADQGINIGDTADDEPKKEFEIKQELPHLPPHIARLWGFERSENPFRKHMEEEWKRIIAPRTPFDPF
jgi:predicted phage terminase large subunit-like protein